MEYRISRAQAQEAIDTLARYIEECRGEISEMEKISNTARGHLNLPDNFNVKNLALSTRARNILTKYYERSKGRVGIFNTYEKDLRRERNCGPMVISEIRTEFERHGISLIK